MGTFSVISDSCIVLQNTLKFNSRIMPCTRNIKGEAGSFPNLDFLHVIIHVVETAGPHSLPSLNLKDMLSCTPANSARVTPFLVPVQMARLRECENVLVALELSNFLNDSNYALQAVTQCYGLLAPIIYHNIVLVPVIQVRVSPSLHKRSAWNDSAVIIMGKKSSISSKKYKWVKKKDGENVPTNYISERN